MPETEIERLIHMNQRLNLVLGYAMALLHEHYEKTPEYMKTKYYWLTESVENLIYLDKPLPAYPPYKCE